MALAQTRIKTLLCPSDDPYASIKGTVYAEHFFNIGKRWNFYAPSWDYSKVAAAANLGRTSYLGVGGAFGRGTNATAGTRYRRVHSLERSGLGTRHPRLPKIF